MLVDPEIQAVLCRILAPFQGPELHTMTVLEIPLGGAGIQLGHHRQWIPAGLRERGGAGDP